MHKVLDQSRKSPDVSKFKDHQHSSSISRLKPFASDTGLRRFRSSISQKRRFQMGHPQIASGGPRGPSDSMKRGKFFRGKVNGVTKQDAADKKVRNKTAKAKARDLRRLLQKKREELPPEVVSRLEEEITSLDSVALHQKKNEKRKRFLVKRKQLYDKIKFYEGQKVRRKIKAERRALSALLRRRRDATNAEVDACTLDASIEEHQSNLRKHLDDLNYILRYPADEPYVALFPSGGPGSEETEKKREEMRVKIRQQILQERIEDENEDNAEGEEEDAFLVAEQPSGPQHRTSVMFDSDGSVVAEDEEEKNLEDVFAEAPDWVESPDDGTAGRGGRRTRGSSRGGFSDRKRSSHEHQHGVREAGSHGRGGAHTDSRGRQKTSSHRGQKHSATLDGGRGSTGTRSGSRGRAGVPGSLEKREESKEIRERKGGNSSQGTDKKQTQSLKEGRERREGEGKRPAKQIEQIGLSKRFAGGKHTVFESDSD
ncbi:hypothetical protein TGP89_240660 [Toxoplasma gondii p89]|uniref:rRNA-processing protein EFG1 n=1 Tax=Toxoplasma gondii p89 TaxID=943119 RepID=A0A086K358_TOXGO|nr:hypothetical protein TGP89_240660 [Toxoplasma gondii p89]